MRRVPIRRRSRRDDQVRETVPDAGDGLPVDADAACSLDADTEDAHPIEEQAADAPVEEESEGIVPSRDGDVDPDDGCERGDEERDALTESANRWFSVAFERLDSIEKRLSDIHQEYERLDRDGTTASRQAELLQSQSREIRRLQDGERLHLLVLPLLQVFVEVIDTIDAERGCIPTEGTAEEYERRHREFLAYLDELFTATLKRHGMTPMPKAPSGSKFDPAVQRAVSVKTVTTPADGIVIGSSRRGYMFNGNVQRAEEVEIQKTKQEEV